MELEAGAVPTSEIGKNQNLAQKCIKNRKWTEKNKEHYEKEKAYI